MTAADRPDLLRAPDVLRTWGEVATYLRISVTTARRYLVHGLPVRKGPSRARNATIYARQSDIDKWLFRRETKRPKRL